jgi:tRNA threonylcarbamoyladenosine biosynthesis protein TsaB
LKLLAFDTSTEACSAALYIDGEIISRYAVAPRQHAELILPMIDQVLAESGCTLNDLDAIAFGRGPGAFTGLRIAAGIAQGLAFSTNLPVIPISSLATLAQSVTNKADYIAAAIDARMQEVYFGLYKSGTVVTLIAEEHVLAPVDIRINNTAVCYGIGSGWIKYESILKNKFAGVLQGFEGQRYPDARDMLTIAIQEFRNGNLQKPEDALPVYLRNKVTG